ncbi:TPA: hypothetical protein NIH14_001829 [Pseudomonas aeruginosa]|nr:hypothetical protein [Pseudomonas aeruginosa]EJO5057988.1 hypothetical protein [Pseudomonas aeruginosa]MCS8058039.1 hypothetical protein [Pseudomonas aeruginosa]HCF5688149.1 hypothetical protein [Pseudomonas aeruginosa]
MSDCMIEMPRYQSHKQVWALKLERVDIDANTLYPIDKAYAPIAMPTAWMAKHQPQAGGYFVSYKDGYQSYSPAEAFEEGNTPMGIYEADIPSLLTFYNVATITQLIAEMNGHVKQLQERLRPFLKEPLQINRVREG